LHEICEVILWVIFIAFLGAVIKLSTGFVFWLPGLRESFA